MGHIQPLVLVHHLGFKVMEINHFLGCEVIEKNYLVVEVLMIGGKIRSFLGCEVTKKDYLLVVEVLMM